VKHLSALTLLLLAACAATGPSGDGRDTFAAAETDPNAAQTAPSPKASDKTQPLTDEEQRQAALLVNRLASAQDEAAREAAFVALVNLGPRYLPFLRSVRDDDIALDLMRVIRRIEKDAQVSDTPTPINPSEIRAGAGEGRKPPPEYADLPGEFDREQVERFIGSRLRNARGLLDAGDTEGAVQVANAALLLLPDTKYRPEFEALILKARNESQAELLIAGTMQLAPEHLQYASRARGAKFAQPLVIKCYLKNVSAGDIRLALYEGPGRESVLVLAVRYEQTDYAGNALTQQGTVRVPIAAGPAALLKPNETHEIEVPLDSLTTLDADAPQKWALGRVQVEANLRVYSAADGSGRPLVLRPVRFAERTILVFPHGFDLAEAARNPVNTVRDLLKADKAQEAFMAAQLCRKNQLRAMGDLLTGDDFEADSLANQRARLRAMATLFSTGLTWDIAKWRRWWTTQRSRQGTG
jgi:hypothetical protein